MIPSFEVGGASRVNDAIVGQGDRWSRGARRRCHRPLKRARRRCHVRGGGANERDERAQQTSATNERQRSSQRRGERGNDRGARKQMMERDDALSHQSRHSTPPFELKVTINKKWRPENDGEASEGGRGGGGGRQEGSECKECERWSAMMCCSINRVSYPPPRPSK